MRELFEKHADAQGENCRAPDATNSNSSTLERMINYTKAFLTGKSSPIDLHARAACMQSPYLLPAAWHSTPTASTSFGYESRCSSRYTGEGMGWIDQILLPQGHMADSQVSAELPPPDMLHASLGDILTSTNLHHATPYP